MRKSFELGLMGLILLMGLIILSSVCSAATIHVPADQPTIQAGIDAAANNDTVLVAPGYYYENISFNGKVVKLRSSNGPEATTIDGSQQSASVVKFLNGEGFDSILDGFTIRGGSGTKVYTWTTSIFGGGVVCKQASPTIMNNVIKLNSAWIGGGIACVEASYPVIENNGLS
ncbi:MAG: hypothetical protein ABIK28_15185 [Planctomycetota bacterium]